MISGAFAIVYDWEPNTVGSWDDADGQNWLNDNGESVAKPDGSCEITIQHPLSICTLDTNEGKTWDTGQRLRVYNGATLNIVNGGGLYGASWARIGTSDGPGTMNQSGGLIRIRRGKDPCRFSIGDRPGSEGSVYTMTGGTLTYLDGEDSLYIGDRGGSGTFKVVGTSPVISMKRLYVAGGSGVRASTGTLAYEVGSAGVSKIMLLNNINIDIEGTGKAYLNLSLIPGETAPMSDIVLAEDMGRGSIEGHGFSTVHHDGGISDGKEGCHVQLGDACYALTYKYDATGDSNNNDLALVYVPEPALLVLLSIASLTAAGHKK
jgi:hypothetical protein